MVVDRRNQKSRKKGLKGEKNPNKIKRSKVRGIGESKRKNSKAIHTRNEVRDDDGAKRQVVSKMNTSCTRRARRRDTHQSP